MTTLRTLKAWRTLETLAGDLRGVTMRDLFRSDPRRFERMHERLGDFVFDYSKNLVTPAVLEALMSLAREAGVEKRRDAMFRGEKINTTENRAVLHTALRDPTPDPVLVDGKDVKPEIREVQARMAGFVEAVHSGDWLGASGGRITDVVNIGIGGSDLGPRMVVDALEPYRVRDLRVHFVSNVDGTDISRVLAQLTPDNTLFLVASKTFTTQETLANAHTARDWLVKALGRRAVSNHFVALSTNLEAVTEFGIDPEVMFEFWDWVGGRYSLWSAIGLSIALAVGWDTFTRLLAGAHEMDVHFRTAPLEQNIPVLAGLIGFWNIQFLGARATAVLPYDQSLARLPAYLQQADMESTGKRTTLSGETVDYPTGAVLFGEPGTNGQHSFYQMIHQGTHLIPCDFLAPVRSHYPVGRHQAILLANMFAQSEALMTGRTEDEAWAGLADSGLKGEALDTLLPHVVFPGNRPSNTMLFRVLDPETLGRIIALYEHRIHVQATLWNLNAYDQFGVELGKRLAAVVLPELEKKRGALAHDASTNGLIEFFRLWSED
ncbi:glucose-6-phosphate isomerase [Phaeovibrio sulfidiphilus]|uniref:Glucose-6-phosphate isomerase n=1 Tax=Phaeovibrio sulfidiphilus TaxID=1220600 RepID=A0A8J6YQ84_9PROT|nr:glucose-6-phosphate isomerase [Phaeovibrio sulfidiphilus]MBE1237706.1 glucose-6-phosphate isomerase [Phaeovibrio sulfidiphilus]